ARKFLNASTILGEKAKRYGVDRSMSECIRYLQEYADSRKGLINVFRSQLTELSVISNDSYEFTIQGLRNKRLVASLHGRLRQKTPEVTWVEYQTSIEKKFFYQQVLFSVLVTSPLFFLLLQGFVLELDAGLLLVLFVPIVWLYGFRKFLLQDTDYLAQLVDTILTR
ncbi:MAG: hypothetical protein K8I30_00035, partial [Anaerolineae bacterium]|nr:hypothetical protein [Anaerolineae bacterium]